MPLGLPSAAMRACLFPLIGTAVLSSPAHAQWSDNGVPVCVESHTQSRPAIVSDGAGGAIIAWLDQRSQPNRIYAQRIDASGVPQWSSNGVPVSQPSAVGPPVAISDGLGGAIIAWPDHRDDGSEDFDIEFIYAQRVNASGVRLWGSSDVGLLTTFPYNRYITGLSIYSDLNPQAGAYVAYSEHNYLPFTPPVDGGSVGFIHVRQDGVILASEAVDISLHENGDSYGVPVVTTDGYGIPTGMYMAWDWDYFDFETGYRESALMATRWDALGNHAWTSTLSFEPAGGPRIAYTGNNNGAIVVWHQGGGLYARWIGLSGIVWLVEVPVCLSAGAHSLGGVAYDGSVGFITSWEDHRGADGDIYAQRMSALGAPFWPADGVALCASSGEQSQPVMVPDGAGGAIAAWRDDRSRLSLFRGDIYAQRVNGAGSMVWTQNGVSVCHEVGIQEHPAMIPLGSGDAIVTWEDDRAGNTDVYAQRLSYATVGVPEPRPLAFRLSGVAPNPTLGPTTLSMELPAPGPVRVDVLDPAGRLIRRLSRAETFPAGVNRVVWDGTTEQGDRAHAGLYFVNVRTPYGHGSARVVLVGH